EDVGKQLREQLGPLGVEVISWREAAGQAAMIVLVLQLVFNAGCVLVIIAGQIGMVNIFLISVFRRTGEIGTLRSIGATDGNIRTILYAENLIISFTAGTAGILLSLAIMAAVNSRHLVLGNSLLSALLGQTVFSFQPDISLALLSLGLSVLIGLTASVYPVATALRIEPVTAMREGR
ncbi:MAG TPA: ABC transporter permease, partial [Spirochaeta sp.]|nr:ABC transporter permease [Spirochaeta sp.]